MYAIVDIETTGGHASSNGITEIAILIHDGNAIIDSFNSLVNPCQDIPVYVQALTGINNEMVRNAPLFEELADQVFKLLDNNIFIAHNVNFDYSFLHFHLLKCGYKLHSKKLCTVRLSRKILPGLTSYSLGKLCRQVGIEITDRHRAFGDAQATACLFDLLIRNDSEGHIQLTLNQKFGEQKLPPNLPRSDMEKLPSVPGVYYFHNAKSKVIYVGKAKNIRKRVSSHFSNNKPGKQKQDFLREIHQITFQECGTELYSFILEALEIKRLWPAFNRSMKRFEHSFALYQFEDQSGYIRLAVDKRRKFSQCLYTFSVLQEGNILLRELITSFGLCPKFCFLESSNLECEDKDLGRTCSHDEEPLTYNARVKTAITHLKEKLPSFLLTDIGRKKGEISCMLMEDGVFYGMGHVPSDSLNDDMALLKTRLTRHSSNDYICNMLYNYALKNPEKVKWLNNSNLSEKYLPENELNMFSLV